MRLFPWRRVRRDGEPGARCRLTAFALRHCSTRILPRALAAWCGWIAHSHRLIGVEVLDHIVIGDGRYASFRERGWL
ncbi:MAG: JAB domain-containing protein [Vicinamibacterales bacterium]